ncbi:MAG: glycosyltransferase [Chloroflexota bacterium]
MKHMLVSIIMPAFNAEAYIAQAIESILAQTYHQWELIVINDGSTDNTLNIVSSFTDHRIRSINQENRGLAGARNTGIRVAQSNTIALLDSDDLWLPEFLKKMKPLLDQHPEAAAVYCGFRYINELGDEIASFPSIKVVEPELFRKKLIFEGNWLVPSAVLFRKKLAEDVGLFDESLRAVEDADLWIRLSAARPFIGLPEALVKYRRHDSNMSKDPERMFTADYRLWEKMFGPPEGEPSSWPEMKLRGYAQLFRSGTSRYLAYGNVEKSAHYFQKLVEISPSSGLSMGLWRGLVRAHFPEVYQFTPDVQLDWVLAQKDIMALLGELAGRRATSAPLQKSFPRIKATAFQALADEAVRANDLSRALAWLSHALLSSPSILLSRPYWGTLSRGAIRLGRSLVAKIGDRQ